MPHSRGIFPLKKGSSTFVQLFKRSSNTVARLSVFLALLMLVLLFLLAELWTRSAYVTNLGVNILQPIPFSHRHHVKGLGLDCRYCHSTVENSAFAGMPTTKTCMGCHSQIWSKSEILRGVRESLSRNTPLTWNRVNVLPDYVFFHHGIHLHKGISCVSCHGHIEEMPLVHKETSFTMRQCLSCHRQPEKYIRPERELWSFSWQIPKSKRSQIDLVEHYQIDSHAITNCNTCHR